jgi:hypothetical protein
MADQSEEQPRRLDPLAEDLETLRLKHWTHWTDVENRLVTRIVRLLRGSVQTDAGVKEAPDA